MQTGLIIMLNINKIQLDCLKYVARCSVFYEIIIIFFFLEDFLLAYRKNLPFCHSSKLCATGLVKFLSAFP